MNTRNILLSLCLFVACALVMGLAYSLHTERKRRRTGQQSVKKNDEASFENQPSKRPFQPVALTLQSPAGKQVLSIRRPLLRNNDHRAWKTIEISPATASSLKPLLGQAADLLKISVLASMANTQTFRVLFDGAGELMRSQSGDGFRSILVDKHSHRIMSHGLLKPVAHFPINGVLAWELASIAVGKKYLADIEKTLKQIKVGVADIMAFLENDRVGRLQADCNLLDNITDELLRDPSFLFRTPSLHHQLLEVEQNASAVARACLLDLQHICEAIKKSNDLSGIVTADSEPLTSAASKSTRTLQAASFALSLRVCCASLLNSYMEASSWKVSRLNDVLSLWRSLNEESMETQIALRAKIDTLSELFSFRDTEEAKKKQLKADIEIIFRSAAHELKSTQLEAQDAMRQRTLLEVGEHPLELDVTVDRNGQIRSARLLAPIL